MIQWLARNVGTVSLLLFAFGAFCTEFAGSLPPGLGARVSMVAIVTLGAARGLVVAMEVLKRGPDA